MRVLCLVAALLPASTAAGESIARARAVAEAVERNLELKAARAGLGSHRAEVGDAARLLRENPTLEAEYGGDVVEAGEYRASVELSQKVEIAGQRGLRRARAGVRLREAEARLRDRELRVARDAADAWAQLQRAEKLRALAAQAVELNAQLGRVAESRYAAGDISEVERNLVALELSRAQADQAAAEAEEHRAGAALSRLLARPPDEPLSAADEPLPPAAPDARALREGARRRRADLLAARRAEEAAEAELALARRDLVPSPTLTLRYEREQLAFSTGGAAPLALTHLADLIVGKLSLPLPIWDRRQTEVRAAEAARAVAAAEREATERAIDAELDSAAALAAAARRALEIYRAALPRADRNLELLGHAYQAGQIPVGELLLAKDRALAVRRESVDAQAAFWRAHHELLRAGGFLPTESP